METLEKKVLIKYIKKASWSGFSRFPKCKDTVVAVLGRGGYNTGLTLEEEKELEKALRLKEGSLDKNSTYWKDYVVHIHDRELELDLNIPKDLLDYKILCNSPKVAKSLKAHLAGDSPKAVYYIQNFEEEAKTENVEVQVKKKAWKKFATMTIADMKQVLKLMGRNADTATDEIVENTLSGIIENTPEEFNKIVGLDNFKTRLLIEDLLHKNLLRKVGSKYLYADDVIGYTLDEAIQYLNDPKNQEILITLQEKLKAKK